MISLKVGGIIVAAFVAGAFIASPELRAYAADTVGSIDIIDESILSVDIKDGEVKASDIGASAITSSEIAANAVTAPKIAANSVGSSEITDNAVTNSEIAADAVGASEIAANAVQSSEISDNAVTSSEIAADSVGASELKGVGKLIFSRCTFTNWTSKSPGERVGTFCTVQGVSAGDKLIGTYNTGDECYEIVRVLSTIENTVFISLKNDCDSPAAIGIAGISVIAYQTTAVI